MGKNNKVIANINNSQDKNIKKVPIKCNKLTEFNIKKAVR